MCSDYFKEDHERGRCFRGEQIVNTCKDSRTWCLCMNPPCYETKSMIKAVRCVWYMSQQVTTSITCGMVSRGVCPDIVLSSQWLLVEIISSLCAFWTGPCLYVRFRWQSFLMENCSDQFSKPSVFRVHVREAVKQLLCQYWELKAGEVNKWLCYLSLHRLGFLQSFCHEKWLRVCCCSLTQCDD